MADILIRGLSPDTVALLDERASTQGVSRNAVITEILSREALERPRLISPTSPGCANWWKTSETPRSCRAHGGRSLLSPHHRGRDRPTG
jgi:hypothetical protein